VRLEGLGQLKNKNQLPHQESNPRLSGMYKGYKLVKRLSKYCKNAALK
jgi:hypothetical protein